MQGTSELVAELLVDIPDARTLAQAIVDTVREPLLVLDKDLRVIAASRSFHLKFRLDHPQVHGQSLFRLDNGQWDIPALRAGLEMVIQDGIALDSFEVVQHFAGLGRRFMLLNARKVFYENAAHYNLLLAFEDISERRLIEDEKDELVARLNGLLAEKDMLFEEMQHRVANSLQIIASILLLKARSVTSEETRGHLQDAHQRVISMAAVQEHLRVSSRADLIDIGPYLTKLCESLRASMIGNTRSVVLEAHSMDGTATSAVTVSLGLIVTELVINALKYAFVDDKPDARVDVSYAIDGPHWRLTVSDNGGGPIQSAEPKKGGLGTSLVKAVAHQLDARVEIDSDGGGMRVSVIQGAFGAAA